MLRFLKRKKPEGFTPEAQVHWDKIAPDIQKRIFDNVFCGRCSGSVVIRDYHGYLEDGLLILDGSCASCGRGVTRAIETDEMSW